jgi:hypothetical protein
MLSTIEILHNQLVSSVVKKISNNLQSKLKASPVQTTRAL